MKKVTPAKVGIYTVLTFWAVTTLYPFVWVILNSFRERGLIRKESFSIPLPGSGFTMDNYAKAMERFDFGNAYLNSLLVSVAVTIMVVLIDDEAIITQGLQKVVDWAAYRCRVAAVAQDAVTGAEVIRQHRPDILFTDIKMPGEDGLTMLAGLKGEFPRMQIAVLTGYRDFEYAQRAIRLGVARFLLKPSRRKRRPRPRRRRTPTASWCARPRPTSRSTATSAFPSRIWPATATSASGTCPSC